MTENVLQIWPVWGNRSRCPAYTFIYKWRATKTGQLGLKKCTFEHKKCYILGMDNHRRLI